jgi:hypothetical protein
MSTWSDFVLKVASEDGSSAISNKTGINQSSIYRWINNDATPSPAHAAKFATTYGADVLDAFVAAGYVTEDDIRPERDLDAEISKTIADWARARAELDNARMSVTRLEEEIATLESRRQYLEEQRLAERQGRTEQVSETVPPEVEVTERLLNLFDEEKIEVRHKGEVVEGDDRSAAIVRIVDWLVEDGEGDRLEEFAMKARAQADELRDKRENRPDRSVEGHEPPMDAAAHSTGRESEKQRLAREQDEAALDQD